MAMTAVAAAVTRDMITVTRDALEAAEVKRGELAERGASVRALAELDREIGELEDAYYAACDSYMR